MSDMRRVHNPGPYELVYNRNGNILAGFTSVTTDITDTVTARLLRKDQLILPVEPTPPPEPEPEPEPTPEPEAAPAPAKAKTTTKKSGE